MYTTLSNPIFTIIALYTILQIKSIILLEINTPPEADTPRICNLRL